MAITDSYYLVAGPNPNLNKSCMKLMDIKITEKWRKKVTLFRTKVTVTNCRLVSQISGDLSRLLVNVRLPYISVVVQHYSLHS